MELLSDIIKDLLKQDGSRNKLQCQGYQLEGDEVKVSYINLNKQCMITRNWERAYLLLGDGVFSHLYKEWTIFLKTREESLV
jgi:hypothetical protein